jgi:hypothetical protein
MPRDFYLHGTKSMNQLFNESGYLEKSKFVTREALIGCLEKNPELMRDWENYSSDKRVSQGWYFLKEKDQWVVGYVGAPSQEQRHLHASKFEACADFILHELSEFAEHATRY